MNIKNNLFLKISVAISYIAMLAVNFLANALPLGGVTTGEASDAYANLFTPAGITFSIWGLIYLLLAGFVVYYISYSNRMNSSKKILSDNIALLFVFSSLANISWIFSWHYGLIPLSVLVMLFLLISLIKIADILRKNDFSITENIFLRIPFSVYFGWITVATIANITVLLVSLNWSGWGISESIWMIIITLVGAAIGIIRGLKDKNIPYLLVLVWAYGGIWLKHTSENGHNEQYPFVIGTVIVCIFLFLSTIGWISFKKKKFQIS